MIVRDEEHLADLVELLKADNVDFAAARRWLDDKAELFMLPVALSDHICRHRHALHSLEGPRILLFSPTSFVTFFILILLTGIILLEIVLGLLSVALVRIHFDGIIALVSVSILLLGIVIL